MCIFQTFQREFGKQHSFHCQLGPGPPRVPLSVSTGLCPGPPLRSALFPGVPNPAPSRRLTLCEPGLQEVPPGEAPRSLLWCHSIVKALHLPPLQGGPMGPAVTLADPSTLKNLHQRQGAWARNCLSAPAAPSWCPSLPFLCPNFQRV